MTGDESGIICSYHLSGLGDREKFGDFIFEMVQYDAFSDITDYSYDLLKSETMTPSQCRTEKLTPQYIPI